MRIIILLECLGKRQSDICSNHELFYRYLFAPYIIKIWLFFCFRINKAKAELKKYSKVYNDREKKSLEGI